MAFRIKNISKFPVRILGVSLQPSSVVDLQLTLTNEVIRASILNGELYHKIQGRMLTVLSPPQDWGKIGLSTDELARLMHAGFFKGFLGLEELKPPFVFDGYGSLSTISSGSLPGTATSVRGISADGAVADGFPVEIGGVDEAGNIQSLLVNTDGYLMTSTALSIELNNEVEGRVFDGGDVTGIKPIIIGGMDEGGLGQTLLVDSDGYLMTSTAISIETNSEVEGRVFDGGDGTGIKPVIISGLDNGGLSRSVSVNTDGMSMFKYLWEFMVL